jgi:hypothetical protein
VTTIPHWNDYGADDSWDNLILGGEFIPGVATVECEDAWKIDFQKAKGADGYKVKDEGYMGADVEITIVIDHRDQLTELARILPMLRPPKKGTSRQPLEIQHPSAAVAGITAIAVEKIRIMQPSAKDGWAIRISAKEWLAGPKTNAGLGSSKGGGGAKCAALAQKLQQAHHDLSAIAARIQFIQGGGGTSAQAKQAEKDYNTKQWQISQLESQLQACVAGVKPPSSEAPASTSEWNVVTPGLTAIT